MPPRGFGLTAMALVGACNAYDRGAYRTLLDGSADADARTAPVDTREDTTRDDTVSDLGPDVDSSVEDAIDATAVTDTGPGPDGRSDANTDASMTNQIVNPSFEDDVTGHLTPWQLSVRPDSMGTFSADDTTLVTGRHSARIDATVGAYLSSVILLQQPLVLTTGRVETLGFWARSHDPGNYTVFVQSQTTPSVNYLFGRFSTTDTWQFFTFSVTASANDMSAQIAFNVGTPANSVWIDDVSFSP